MCMCFRILVAEQGELTPTLGCTRFSNRKQLWWSCGHGNSKVRTASLLRQSEAAGKVLMALFAMPGPPRLPHEAQATGFQMLRRPSRTLGLPTSQPSLPTLPKSSPSSSTCTRCTWAPSSPLDACSRYAPSCIQYHAVYRPCHTWLGQDTGPAQAWQSRMHAVCDLQPAPTSQSVNTPSTRLAPSGDHHHLPAQQASTCLIVAQGLVRAEIHRRGCELLRTCPDALRRPFFLWAMVCPRLWQELDASSCQKALW